MCSKLEGIFKHIGLTTWTHATLVDVMSCHKDDVVKKLACLTKVWTHTPHKPEQLIRRLVVPRGNNACLMTNGR